MRSSSRRLPVEPFRPPPLLRAWRAWLAALLLSLLAHAWLLAPASAPQGQRVRAPAAPLLTRSVAAPAPPAPAPATATAALPPAPAAPAAPPAPTPPAAAVRSADAAAARASAVAAPEQAGEAATPLPPATPAPAAEWLYRLDQNGQQGRARLSWQPLQGGYRLRLERELAGRPLPGWRSEGALDGQGLAPQRYAQQRGGRDAQATNFRRDEGLISFSASAELVAMPAGVQDRLSWWLQLAARVNGAPQRFGPGSALNLPVAGLRGEAREWRFEVLGEDSLSLPIGVLTALHLRRAPLGPYDGGLDIWLDPRRAHLPVRIVAAQADGRGWELQLLDEDAPARDGR
ncbi:MAG: DUF3108 domain-containing protein [Burkholderiaceae bacterium]